VIPDSQESKGRGGGGVWGGGVCKQSTIHEFSSPMAGTDALVGKSCAILGSVRGCSFQRTVEKRQAVPGREITKEEHAAFKTKPAVFFDRKQVPAKREDYAF